MGIVDFISRLQKLGIRLQLEGRKLKINAPEGVLTDRLIQELKSNKPAIVEFLGALQPQDDLTIKPISSDYLGKSFPSSFAQQRLWFLAQMDTENTAYNMPATLRLKGPLDIEVLRKSFETIIQRHAILRTSFIENDGIAEQIIHQMDRWELPIDDLTIVDGKELTTEEKEAEAVSQANLDREHYFSLSEWPLIKTRLLKLGETDHCLLVNMHHIVGDGWSIGVFMRELSDLYQAYAENKPNPLTPLAVQYADYAHWQRQWLQGDVLDRQVGYWKKQLHAAPDLLHLPTDRPRPAVQTFNGLQIEHQIDAELAADIKALALRLDASPFMIMLAGFQLMLGKYAQMHDVCVGVPVAGRAKEELEPLIGFFVNSVVIRTHLDGNPSVLELIEQVKQTTLAAFAHQDVPAELILDALDIERHLDHTPLAQVGFAYEHQVTDKIDELAGGLQVDIVKTEQVTAKYDLTLYASETDSGYGCTLEYNTDLFNQESIERMLRHYHHLLASMISDPEQMTQHLSLTTEGELASLLKLDQTRYQAVLPLTAMQRDLYLSSLRNPDTLENSLGYAVEMHHKLDVDIWREELLRFSDSQSIMRADVIRCDAPYVDIAYLCIKHLGEISLDIIDLSDCDAVDVQEQIKTRIKRPYSFDEKDRSSLANHHIIKLADDNWLTIFATHHMVMDGLAYVQHLGTIVENYEKRMADKDSAELDRAELDGSDLLVKPDLFAEYIEFDQLEVDSVETLDHWRDQLKSVEPVDYKVQKPINEIVRKGIVLSTEHSESLRLFCRKQKITPAIYFKAVYGLLINHYCRADNDFVLSETVAGRPKGHTQSVGCYYLLNPFVCHHTLYDECSLVSDLFQDARNQQKKRKGKLQFSIMQQSLLVAPGRLGFMYNFIHFMGVLNLMGVDEEVQEFVPDVETQVQFLVKVIDADFHIFLDYHGAHFEDNGFLERFESISQQIVAGVEHIGQLAIVNPKEQALVEQWSAGDKRTIIDRPVQRPFEELSVANPELTAVIFGDTQWNYRQLNETANRLANTLIEAGLRAD
ncbi:MAG: hypothetical protein COA99_17540, partial [Moraxellaceae bacterium]